MTRYRLIVLDDANTVTADECGQCRFLGQLYCDVDYARVRRYPEQPAIRTQACKDLEQQP